MPRPREGSRRAKIETENGTKRVSRREATYGKEAPPMPPMSAAHIVGWLMEIGLTEAAGMGSAPLSWREIRSWRLETATIVQPWEAKLIRRLSIEYLAESRAAEDERRPAPWHAPVTQHEIEREEARLRLVLG